MGKGINEKRHKTKNSGKHGIEMFYPPGNQLKANQSTTLANAISRNLKHNKCAMKTVSMTLYIQVLVWTRFQFSWLYTQE